MSVFNNHDDLTKDPLYIELFNATDRAAAIVATALIDDKLTNVLKSKLRQDKDAINRLLKPGGPLGQLQNKSELAYLMGVFSKGTRDDINCASWIRNRFAHWATPLTFDTKIIREKCEEIQFLKHLPDASKIGWDTVKTPFPKGYARYSFMAFVVIIADILDQISNGADPDWL